MFLYNIFHRIVITSKLPNITKTNDVVLLLTLIPIGAHNIQLPINLHLFNFLFISI